MAPLGGWAGVGRVSVAVPAPGAGFGCWAGAPSAALDADGSVLLAYRVRDVERRGAEVVIARGEAFAPVVSLGKERFGAESLERPALVRTDDGWRLYVCCATPGSKHWWIDALDAPDVAGLAEADPLTVLPGDAATGVKDPVVRRAGDRWEAWICCHPLDEPGEEDRMTTAFATSQDGLAWEWQGTALAPRPGHGTRAARALTAVLADGTSTTTAGRPRRRTSASARGSSAARLRSPTCGTSTSSHSPAAAGGCSTRRRSPTGATSFGASS